MPDLVLFITADDRLRARVSSLLAERGRRVQHAAPSATHVPELGGVGCVILDAAVPDGDASALVGRLRARPGVRVPVLVLAGREHAEAGVAALRAGADDVVFLPVDPLGLPARVDALLARRALDEAREQVTALEYRNQELESFIYIVTHDMKTPVVNVQGLVGLVEQDHLGQLPAPVAEYLVRLRRNAERLEELLRDLLEYPRRLRVMGPVEVRPLQPVVAAAVDGLAEQARAGGVDVVVAPDLPPVACDAKRLQQVFHNLLDNAIKHARGQGRPRVEVGWTRTADGVRFHVKDNGPGVPTEHVQDVFRLFHRVPGTRAEGSGIGLAVVRQLVEAHGGEVWCESEAGSGAAFYFTLAA